MKKQTSGIKKLSNGKLHAVRYIHKPSLDAKELVEQGIYRVKPGISSCLTWKQYVSETIRNEPVGKKPLMWDDTFLHQHLTKEQADQIITLSDSTFKQLMKLNGYTSREIHKDKSIGTEYVESDDLDSLIEVIKETFDKSYKIAYEYVMKEELPNGIDLYPFEPRKGQDTLFINPLVEWFNKNNLASAQSHGGTGKTKMSFAVSQIVCETILKKPWKVLGVSDNIANTVQLASEFSLFYKGQTGKRLMDIYLIGSADKTDYKVLESWANVYQIANVTKVKRALKDSYKSNGPSAWFVVNKSAEKFLQLADSSNVDFKNWFTIPDEIQQYSTENDQVKIVDSSDCAVVNPKYQHLFGKMLSLSATHICRPDNVTDLRAVFNDDVDKFGKRIVDIDELTARGLGWICEKEGLIIPLPTTPEFLESVKEKRPFQTTIAGETFNIHPPHFAAFDTLVNYILPIGKTHPLILTTFIKDIELISKLLKYFQSIGKIDSQYEIIEGYAKGGNASVNRFNKAKKAIMIATRWVMVGQDTYKCDCTLPLYNPKSMANSRQFSMRGDRKYEDKVSMLAFTAMDYQLEDSNWFKIMENISNGKIPNIISEADFKTIIAKPGVIGSHLNPKGGNNVGNVTIVKANNHDPKVFEEWEQLSKHIALKTYTDKNGNSLFSKIMYKYSMEKLSKYASMVELIVQNPNLYNYIWQTNDDKIADKIFKKYSDYYELPNTESELQKYVTTKWKKRPTENTYAIEQMLRIKFSVIYK
jgi:hypothetical protein